MSESVCVSVFVFVVSSRLTEETSEVTQAQRDRGVQWQAGKDIISGALPGLSQYPGVKNITMSTES